MQGCPRRHTGLVSFSLYGCEIEQIPKSGTARERSGCSCYEAAESGRAFPGSSECRLYRTRGQTNASSPRKTSWSPASTRSTRACRIRQLPGFCLLQPAVCNIRSAIRSVCVGREPLASFLCFDAERDGGPGARPMRSSPRAKLESTCVTRVRRAPPCRGLPADRPPSPDDGRQPAVTGIEVIDMRRGGLRAASSVTPWSPRRQPKVSTMGHRQRRTVRLAAAQPHVRLRFERPARPAMERAHHAGGLPALSRRAARLLHAAHRPLPVRVPHPGGLRRSPLAEGSRQRGAPAR